MKGNCMKRAENMVPFMSHFNGTLSNFGHETDYVPATLILPTAPMQRILKVEGYN